MNWSYFILGIVVYQIIKMLVKVINQEVIGYRRRRFLKMVSILFPGNEKITIITIDTTDRHAMKRLERQLREDYEVPEESVVGQ